MPLNKHYTRTELIAIRNKVVPISNPTSDFACDSLKHLITCLRKVGICKTATHRGCRGSGHKKTIPVISIPYAPSSKSKIKNNTETKRSGVNSSNIIPISFNNSPPLELLLLNVRSICNSGIKNKPVLINDYITDHQLDIIALTETWIKPTTCGSTLAAITPPGYSLDHVPRPGGGRGGGVALIYRDSFKVKRICTPTFTSFEHMSQSLSYRSKTYLIIVVYRSPTIKSHGPTFNTFLKEFAQLLENIVIDNQHLIIMGDFNIHVDDDKCQNATRFKDLIDTVGLVQSVMCPTHKHGHTLDLILTRPEFCPASIEVSDIHSDIFDHFTVRFSMPTQKPPLPKRVLTYRKVKSIDADVFAEDIKQSKLFSQITDDVDELTNRYNNVLSELLDKHAPIKSKTITVHTSAPWYTDEINIAKQKRRKAERKWRKTRLEIDRQLYQLARDEVTSLIARSKESYYKERISSSSNSQATLFSCVQELLNVKKCATLPITDTPKDLANKIATFFDDKIMRIRAYLSALQHQTANDQDAEEEQLVDSDSFLLCFSPVCEKEIEKLIMKSATKTCCLDPIPTHLLKKVLHVLLPVITKIINLSFRQSRVPEAFKMAAVIPLLKKIFLDPEVFTNLRPVSTLPFVSKVMEKAAGKRLRDHKCKNNLNEKMQSAYREGHSTETALVRIQHDVLMSMDQKKCVFLVLLDLSAAFDTVDHKILCRRLSDRFGIKDKALEWVTSYLSGRSQFVVVSGEHSNQHQLDCNVPQGSVLGPGFFSDYNSPVADIFRRHGVQYHLYADDTQVYIAFNHQEEKEALERLENCIQEVRLWMAGNSLKLNESKTDFMVLGSKHALKNVNTKHVTVGDEMVVASSSVKNIGAVLDQQLKMDKHVNSMCKTAWYSLHRLGKLKMYLSDEQLKNVVHASVISKLDQNNSLLVGAPKYLVSKLQSIQNAAAKMIQGYKRYDQISPPLAELHWLPISYRIEFKTLLLTFKCLNNNGPQYLKELLVPYDPPRSLRSTSAYRLVEPKTQCTAGDRAFGVAAPRLWNNLPLDIKLSKSTDSFKRNLKTYLFRMAHQC